MNFRSRKFFLIAFVALATFFQSIAKDKDPAWTKKVGTAKLKFKKQEFVANNFGAKADSTFSSTAAIQKAIDACEKAGGGTVTLNPGRYLIGSLYVKSNVKLRIDDGVELLGSQNIKDYPIIDTRIAGMEMKWPSALVNIIDQKNAAVEGKGLINARGKVFWELYWSMRKDYEARGLRWIVDYDAQRPRTILVQNCENVQLKDFRIKQAGFWSVQVLYSTHITVDGLNIRNNIGGKGPSTDGVDIDSSSWILVQNCDIDCNDDNFCLKAGRDWDGLRVNRPTEYVVIRNSIARRGAGLLTLGSETSGMIRHVLAKDLIGLGTSNGINIKSALTRGGGIEDIHFKNFRMDSVNTAFQIGKNWNPSYSYSTLPKEFKVDEIPVHWQKMLNKVMPAEKGIPVFKDVYITNMSGVGLKRAFNIAGIEGSPVERFNFSNINLEVQTAGTISFAKDWKMLDVKITAKDGTKVKVENSTGVAL
ncbi:glycoside hydrolase family 28 protein [Pedobacter cryophilus]|uniref:Glycoside hydrolase family 28 protein n=1 Tax=Pedobacter cryophilus TaxID=2571271 RepID=A0A4U1BXJ4_9SPHI|nr:glycoside hydrolase family 28 protein [Pedobacter cryophilus]TKB96246.1 glycoside hydrolase family 28 protein [Pedobacter cryophilus]